MIELLKTFIVVYETRNFSLAAKQLYKTQPTISLQIQRLEAELGFKLFERKGKQLILPTSQAEFLYPRVVESLRSLSTIFSQAKDTKNFKTSVCDRLFEYHRRLLTAQHHGTADCRISNICL